MVATKKHEAWLRFQRDVLNVPIGRTVEELNIFLGMAHEHNYALVPVIRAYIDLAEQSETTARHLPLDAGRSRPARTRARQMHLFDLLRDKMLFPQNLDLARFAARVVPNMRSFRFDKMSRSDIAARVIEYLEESDPANRAALELSMREALETMKGRPIKEAERRTFFSEWEAIIKGERI